MHSTRSAFEDDSLARLMSGQLDADNVVQSRGCTLESKFSAPSLCDCTIREGGMDRYDYESLSSKSSFDRYLSHMYDISAQWSRQARYSSPNRRYSAFNIAGCDVLSTVHSLRRIVNFLKNLFFPNPSSSKMKIVYRKIFHTYITHGFHSLEIWI